MFRRDEARYRDPYRSVFQALDEPSPEVSPNPGGVVSGAAFEVWRLRSDLQQAFAIDTPQGQLGLARWFVRHGCAESQLDPAFARSVAERLEQFDTARRGGGGIFSARVPASPPHWRRARGAACAGGLPRIDVVAAAVATRAGRTSCQGTNTDGPNRISICCSRRAVERSAGAAQ